MTYEAVLSDYLSRLPDDIDKREGSIAYDAGAPICAEIAKLYSDLSYAQESSMPDTAESEWLDRLVVDRGLSRRPATSAVITATMSGAGVPTGSRFTVGAIAYYVTSVKNGVYYLTCETVGTAGNISSGSLVPVDSITGLTSATITGISVEAEDEETDESLRQRYYESVNAYPFGGNVTQYKDYVNDIDGVGACKVIPAWNGGGTVKIIIASGTYGAPSDDVVTSVKETLDPDDNGDGMGVAPIGHHVTVVGAQLDSVDIGVTATYATGWTASSAQTSAEDAIKAYFEELAQTWGGDSDTITVKRVQIEARLIELAAFDDISSITLAGVEGNYTVKGSEYIPAVGTVTLS